MSTNGRIPEAELDEVAVGVQLLKGAANAYRALVAQAAHEHVSIKPAAGVGSGYRDLAIQRLFWAAWYEHDEAAAKKVDLNVSTNIVAPAAPGGSSHGWGNRIDLLFDGSNLPTTVHLNLCKRFGFTREFGSADSNHVEHDGKTAIQAPGTAGYYTVVEGDNLTKIAQAHHITLEQLEHLNPQITTPDLIHVGQKVRVR